MAIQCVITFVCVYTNVWLFVDSASVVSQSYSHVFRGLRVFLGKLSGRQDEIPIQSHGLIVLVSFLSLFFVVCNVKCSGNSCKHSNFHTCVMLIVCLEPFFCIYT